MNLFILLWIAQVVWANKVDFYHEKSMLTFSGPKTLRDDSFFGYSTTYDRFNKRLIIGAPREDIVGSVYECNITTTKCSKLRHTLQVDGKYKHDYWFGATVRAGSKFIVACAPRLAQTVNYTVGMFGACSRSDKANDKFSQLLKTRPREYSPFRPMEIDMETLGWDMAIGPDGDERILVGGPAMTDKKGLAADAVYPKNELHRISAVETTTMTTDVSFNFGYSVALGYFIYPKHSPMQLSYAIGSTYGSKGPGEVFFRTVKHNFKMKLNKEVDTDLVGSMFGAVLCAANLKPRRTGTKKTDLLVGAPTYAEKSGYNAGAVYVYIFAGRGLSPVYKRTIKSQKSGSFFGSAIVTVGDLNADGADEVAIGAPYENDGEGAVYLYSGALLATKEGELVNLNYLQRLQPKEHYRSFGLSMSALQDHDNNGCNELAVSAPYDDKVTLYRCMAAVTIFELSAEFPNLQNRSSAKLTEFTFHVCIDVKYPSKPKEIQAEISTDVQIMHQSAKLSKPNSGSLYNFKTSLNSKERQYCEPIGITLPLEGDYSMEIAYKITTELLNSPVYKDDFDERNVILSDASKLNKTGSVWAAECNGTKDCNPILELKINTNMSNEYTIGSTTSGVLLVNILNTGEVAYDPCLHIQVKGTKAHSVPMDCARITELEQTWECISRKPLRTNMAWNITNFVVNLRPLTSNDSAILFNVTLFNSCKIKNITTGQSHEEIVIKLKSDTKKVDIKGSNKDGDIVSVKKDDLLKNGKRLEHHYTISNKGVTNFKDLVFKVKLQKQKFIKYSETPVSYYVEGTSDTAMHKPCSSVNDTEEELTIECTIGYLIKQYDVKVVASIDIDHGEDVYNMLSERNMTTKSSIELFLPHETITKTWLITLITLQKASVDWWIYVLAGVVGVCLIIILALILYECGFLRRKNKEELEKLKTNVRRQSQYRQSMMQQQSRSEDRRTILERTEEVDEAAEEVVQQPQP